MDSSEVVSFIEKVRRLSIKMRFLRELKGAGSETSELKDREMLILELVGSQGPITVSDIRKHFPNIGASTISADLKRLRINLGFIEKRFGIEDERTHLVELTQRGAGKVREINEKRAEIYKPLAACFRKMPKAAGILPEFLDLAISEVDQALKEYGWSN